MSVTDTAGQLGECPFRRSKSLSNPPPPPTRNRKTHLRAFPSTHYGLTVIVCTFASLIYQPPLIVNEACYGPAAIKDETAKRHARGAAETGRNTDVIVGRRQEAVD